MDIPLDHLPPLSPLVPQLLELDCEDDDAEARLLKIVESDPALGARLLSVANSAACAAPGVRYATIVSAVRRIGLRKGIHLATSLLFVRSMGRGLPVGLAQALWLHALALAFAAQELARLKRFPEPNAAYFLGLVHDLGYMAMEILRPGVLQQVVAGALEGNITQEQAELRLFGMEHPELSARLLEHWKLPADLVTPLRDHHVPDVTPGSMAAVLFGAEKIARCAEVGDALYAGLDHPFKPLAIDRDGIECLIAQQLEMGGDAVCDLVQRIIDQVAGLRETAAAMIH